MWESAVRGIVSQAAEPLTINRPQETIIDMVTGSGAVVQLVLLLLLGFSVASWAIIFTKRRQVRRAERESERFIDIFWDAKNLTAINTASLDSEGEPRRTGVSRRLPGARAHHAREARSVAGRRHVDRPRRCRERRARDEARRVARDHEAREVADVPRNDRERGAVRRPLRHGVGHHERVSRPQRHAVVEHPGGGTRHLARR